MNNRPNTSRFRDNAGRIGDITYVGEDGPERIAGETGRTYTETDAKMLTAVVLGLVGFWWGVVAIAVAVLS